MRCLFSFLLLVLVSVVRAASTKGNRLLVVLEDISEWDGYSKFWGDLEGLGPALTAQNLLKFLNEEGNILLALSPKAPTPTALISLLLELDIHLPPERTNLVVDHFNYDVLSASEKHDVVLLPRPNALREDVRNFFGGGGKGEEVIAFPRGVGHTLGNASPLLSPVLRAPRTAYAYNPKDEAEVVEEPFAVGQQLSLVSTLQARNNARFTVLGAVEMLSNDWFDASVKRSLGEGGAGKGAKAVKTVNRAFAKEISAWTFSETGVLRVSRVEHYLSASDATSREVDPKIYRVKNDVTYSIELSEHQLTHYAPFLPPPTDELQLEVTMLSPFHRLPLKPTGKTANSTIFTASFTLPDQHGIFAFRVNYKRPFFTNIDEKRTVTVRHFAHDEWLRSWAISGGWVWIAGVWGTVVGWVLFVGLWMYNAPRGGASRVGSGKKAQ
ncbi:MAG: oligosaccharyl transferase glycoprotein complex, beta subunit [Geoglossum umbratile]|nr:MAG: oligosaccharyl transferase glycoprotein complex, beta subunit [Geoglossum umbratile]